MRARNNQPPSNQRSGNIWNVAGLILAVGWILYWFYGLYNHTFLLVMILFTIVVIGVAAVVSSRRRSPS